ncbi:hypothetical protein BU24DRAFT_156112 [Aaosphaeria arxii CBS 175.79]|uniref:Uncharacterized protein n=1 Tax=Aaosphaeria arxii CBS 175.79 TaxID=1450172 RepID=A0A6A5XWH1_9PLEO|nr:uncharacterized protein BU24DRAFT_156112 [Aaosphaeria arxii CBS 175.79]KAF2017675.1 hypothetical protein BU24DRAFT_156112 [Aaosphaeria arxii CBS 175.79]
MSVRCTPFWCLSWVCPSPDSPIPYYSFPTFLGCFFHASTTRDRALARSRTLSPSLKAISILGYLPRCCRACHSPFPLLLSTSERESAHLQPARPLSAVP